MDIFAISTLTTLTAMGVVDMLDISIAAYAFGSYPGHPRWNPLADVNHDNYVDMVDLSLIARHFGEL